MGRKDKHRTAVKSLSLKVGDLKQVKERVPLTAAQKEEIGRLVRAGVPKVQLAKDYRVDDGTIRRVAKSEVTTGRSHIGLSLALTRNVASFFFSWKTTISCFQSAHDNNIWHTSEDACVHTSGVKSDVNQARARAGPRCTCFIGNISH